MNTDLLAAEGRKKRRGSGCRGVGEQVAGQGVVGVGCQYPNLIIGVSEGLCYGREGSLGFRAELVECEYREKAEGLIGALHGVSQGRCDQLWLQCERAERSGCVSSEIGIRRVGEGLDKVGYGWRRNRLRHRADSLGGKEAIGVVGGLHESQQRRQGIRAEVGQGHQGSLDGVGFRWIACQSKEFRDSGRCGRAKGLKGWTRGVGTLFGSGPLNPICDGVGSLGVGEFAEEVSGFVAPGRALVLDPLHEERERVGADVADGLGGVSAIGPGRNAVRADFSWGATEDHDPISEGVSVVSGLRLLVKDGDRGQEGRKAEYRNQGLSVLPHGRIIS
jgi:hypothetical protein